MRVVDVRDFDIPSDENDYDELVAFADTMASIPQFDAVPMSVIEDIKADIRKPLDEERTFDTENAKAQAIALNWCLEIIDKHIESISK